MNLTQLISLVKSVHTPDKAGLCEGCLGHVPDPCVARQLAEKLLAMIEELEARENL